MYCLNGKVKHGFCSSEAYSSHKLRHFYIIITSYCPVDVRASNSCLALIVTVCFNVQFKSMFQHCLTMKISPLLRYSPVFLNLSLSLNILLIIIIPSLFPPTVLFLLSLLSASHSSHHFISFFFNTSGNHCLPISILPFSGSLLAILHSCLDPLSSLTLLSFPLFLSNLLLSLMYLSHFQKHCCEGFPRQLHWTVHIETMTNVLNHSGNQS